MINLSCEKPTLFKGRHFNHLLIIQAVRWYVAYKLSYRDVCDLMAERGVTVVHTTVLRWAQRFVPAFEKQWKNYARSVGSSWRVDETYIKVKGQWRYLYRAVDELGQTVDFLLSKNRDKAAAVRFFKKAIGNNEVPEKITLDGSRASHQAVAELKAEGVLPTQTLVRASKYLNNLIEQDHRMVKQRCYPMLGFKTFGNAEVTLSGIELANKIKKGQFDTSEITSQGA
jgi:transposase-like protein